MSFFKGKAKQSTYSDFSGPILSNSKEYKLGIFNELGLKDDIAAMAYDPIQSLFCVGSRTGQITLFGQSSVQLRFTLPRPIRIKFIRFYLNYLIIIDAAETLFIYDYAARIEGGKLFKDSSQTLRAEVTCLDILPSLPFILIGLSDGTVEVFDISRGALARSSRISNLWLAQDELNRRSGIEINRTHVPMVVEIKFHPTDLSKILIGYESGVVLYDIKERKPTRSWEFILPPGASGGGNENGSEALFSERRLGVTALTFRPDGLVFAVGHTDGCISFVSPDDENVLLMRTIDRASVEKISEEDIFGWSDTEQARLPAGREPIFKISWSGYPPESWLLDQWSAWNVTNGAIPSVGEKLEKHSGTLLTILGGTLAKDPHGIHILHLPEFDISTPPRAAISDSIQPIHQSFYPTTSTVEDYILLPRTTAQFDLNFDPKAIIILTGLDGSLPVAVGEHGERAITAYSFPPPIQGDGKITAEELPSSLSWTGDGTASKVGIYSVSRYIYQHFYHQIQLDEEDDRRGKGLFSGGKATPLERNPGSESSFKEASFRIIISLHVDLSIRFFDASSHLLANPGPSGLLTEDFPRALPHLTIYLKDLLTRTALSTTKAGQLLRDRPWELEIMSFSWAREAEEISIFLSTGDIIIYRFAYGDGYQEQELDSTLPDLAALEIHNNSSLQVLDLSSLPTSHHDGFSPVTAIHLPCATSQTQLSLIEHSDIGFVAASNGKSLLILDLRGNQVILYEAGIAERKDKKGKAKDSSISSLTWTICSTSKDNEQSVRLVVVSNSGSTKIYEFHHSAQKLWRVNERFISFHHDLPNIFSTFILDKESGRELRADQFGLQKSQDQSSQHPGDSLLVTISQKNVSVFLGLDGGKLSSFENEVSHFKSANLISRGGYTCLAVVSSNQEITILALPSLFIVTKLNFENKVHSDVGAVSIAQDGEFIQFLNPLSIKLGTIFDYGRFGSPSLQLYDPTRVVHSIESIRTGVSSYLGLGKGSTLAEIDSALGGTNRLPPKKRLSSIETKSSAVNRTSSDIISAYKTPNSYTSPLSSTLEAPTRVESVQAETNYLAQAMQYTSEALAQRGEHLENLSNAISEASVSARQFAIDASNNAKKEAAKRTVMGGLSSFFK